MSTVEKYEVKTLYGNLRVIKPQYEKLLCEGWDVVSPITSCSLCTDISLGVYVMVLRKTNG